MVIMIAQILHPKKNFMPIKVINERKMYDLKIHNVLEEKFEKNSFSLSAVIPLLNNESKFYYCQ